MLIQEELGFTMRLSRRGGRTVHVTSNGTSYVRLVSDRLRINSIVTLEGTRLDTEWRTGAITYVSAARVRTWFMNDSDPFANFDTTQTYYYSSNYDAGGGTVPTLGSRVRGEGAIVTASGETKMGSAEAAIATDDTGPYTSTCFFEVTSNGCCYSYTYESSAQTTTVTACSNGYGRSLHQASPDPHLWPNTGPFDGITYYHPF